MGVQARKVGGLPLRLAQVRQRLVAATGGRDLPIALLEDAVAVLLGLFVVSSVM